MMEFLRHIFGLCGEHWHPNIFTILFGATAIYRGAQYLMYRIRELMR